MNYQELELAGIDVNELLDRFMNNTVLVKLVIGKFLEDQNYNKLKEAIEAGALQTAEFACHSLKGICGNLSLKALFALMQEQLRLFRCGEGDAAVAMMDRITQKYDVAVQHLRFWMSQQ